MIRTQAETEATSTRQQQRTATARKAIRANRKSNLPAMNETGGEWERYEKLATSPSCHQQLQLLLPAVCFNPFTQRRI